MNWCNRGCEFGDREALLEGRLMLRSHFVCVGIFRRSELSDHWGLGEVRKLRERCRETISPPLFEWEL